MSECLGEADQEAAGHRARDADAADDGGGEREEPGLEADGDVSLVREPEDDAGGACERGADEEGHDDHAVDVDPHHRRRFLVERRRAHRLPGLRPLHEEPQDDHQDERADDDDDLRQRHCTSPKCEARQVERAVLPARRCCSSRGSRRTSSCRVLEEERDAEGGDERRDARRVAQPPVREALDHDAEQRTPSIAGERQSDEQREIDDRRLGVPPSRCMTPKPMNAPHHVDVAVREVQELEDPVHHRVAERDQRVERSRASARRLSSDEKVPVHPQSLRYRKGARPHLRPRPAVHCGSTTDDLVLAVD